MKDAVKFEHISLEQGLSQSIVYCIVQDNSGFMWFGTEDGLNKYNGHRFTIYKPTAGSDKSLSGNWITAMIKDRAGNLWIGTGSGLNTYNFETGEFVQYLGSPGQPGGLSHHCVNCLLEDSAGRLWIGTRHGLNLFDRQKEIFIHYLHQPGKTGGVSHNDIASIYEDRSGAIWIGTTGGGLNKFDPRKETFSHFTDHPGKPGGPGHNDISSICEDRYGGLWIGTAGDGLNRLDREKGIFITYKNNPDKPGSLSHNNISSIYEDRSGDLWIGTKGGGLNKFHREKGTFDHYRADIKDPFSLSHNTVSSIYQDQTNVLWVGTWDGLNKLDREKKKFSHYQSGPDNPGSLSNNEVRAIYEDNRGVLWVGLDDGGLDQLNPKTNRFIHHKADPGNPGSLSYNYVRSIYEDSRGILWVGTDGGGLNKAERKKNRLAFTRYRANPGNPDSLAGDHVYAILEDRAKRLWIGTYGGGLDRLDRQTGRFIHSRYDKNDPHSLGSDFVRVLYLDSRDTLWIGTDGGGLNKLEQMGGNKKNRFRCYRKVSHNSNSLSSNIVFSICEDSRGILWIGTDGGGLNKFHREKGTFTHYDESHGLPNNVVYGILEDEQANLWLSTNRGLSRFNPETGAFKNYTASDGLQSSEFNANAFHKSKSGEMFFGGIRGFNAFYPADIKDNPYIPPIAVTDFKIFNRSVIPGREVNGRVVLSKPITRTREITLSYRENVFSIEFAALHYAAPQKNRYAYRMEGLETEWNTVEDRRFVTYAKLSPGEYVFRVKGSNNDGLWNEKGASLKITITPPFWRTWWFMGLFLLAVLLSIFAIIKYRTYRIRVINAELERGIENRTRELMAANERAERARIAAEEANKARGMFLARMSHEIRTPMNGVIGFTDILLDTNLDDEQLEYVRTINRSSRALLSLLNDILDFSKIEAGQLALEPIDFDPEVMAFDICDLMKPRIEGKPIEVNCSIGERVPAYVKGDAGRYRQVLINLMGNAVKFTEKGNVELSIDVDEETHDRQKLHAAIKDTGVGIPKDKIDVIFDVFQQADNTITRNFGGTGLGLSISRQFANLMHGDIRAESEPGKGSTFHFTAWLEKSRKKINDKKYLVELAGKKVLIVDDHKSNLDVLSHALESVAMKVSCLSSSAEVLPVIREAFNGGKPFDICILDIQMPGISGYELSRQIRALDTEPANIPLLAFSSSSAARSRKYRQAGFDGFLPKPLQRQKLYMMIEQLLKEKVHTEKENNGKNKRETMVTQYSIRDEAKHSVCILLAEDNPINQKLAVSILTRAGYNLELAVNGKEAVKMYSAAPDNFDLILMDIQMPEMNGIEATKKIRRFETGRDSLCIPIIAITAGAMKGDREKCLAAGMNDYISKPVKREDVFKMVKKWALERES